MFITGVALYAHPDKKHPDRDIPRKAEIVVSYPTVWPSPILMFVDAVLYLGSDALLLFFLPYFNQKLIPRESEGCICLFVCSFLSLSLHLLSIYPSSIHPFLLISVLH